MIRYRQLTDTELAECAKKVTPSDPASQLQKLPTRVKRSTPVKVKASAVKKRHYARKTEPPPRKIAGRHAAPKPGKS